MKAQQDGTQGIVEGSEAACHTAREDMERAVEAYSLLEGSPPANEMALVPNYLVVASPLMDLDRNGNVIPALGSGCT
jgi:hypothetical protein